MQSIPLKQFHTISEKPFLGIYRLNNSDIFVLARFDVENGIIGEGIVHESIAEVIEDGDAHPNKSLPFFKEYVFVRTD